MDFDIVIRGGTVVDGTGRPGRTADIGVSDGLVALIDEAGACHGQQTLDASGCIVAPGFIDIHTHYDAQVFWDPWLTPSAFHGVTTVIAGNCGFSIAPVLAEGVEILGQTLQHVEDMSLATLLAGVPWSDFEDFPSYLDALERRGVSLNYGCYVGHTAVRLYEMGEAAYERAATDAELVAMHRTVARALDAGAVGFATTSSPTHTGAGGRPVPSRLADATEVRTLLEALRDAGRGVAALVPGDTITTAELFYLQRHIGRPFTWTALLTSKGHPYYERVMADHDAARAGGVDVRPQVSCRPIVFQMNLAEPFMFNMRPSFAALMGRSTAERLAAYRDPVWRASAWNELQGGRGAFRIKWDSLVVAESDARPDLVGRRVVDLAEEGQQSALDIMLDLSLGDDLRSRFWSVVANDDPEGIAWLLPRDGVLLGLADSGAHVSQLCDACFATDLLGPWVRDREVMPLERAVFKLTGEPARFLGLHDRGTLEVGKAADIVVFDPATVAPGPLRRIRDFPAGGERLTADAPTGMVHTLVNGAAIRLDGEMVPDELDARPGTVLR